MNAAPPRAPLRLPQPRLCGQRIEIEVADCDLGADGCVWTGCYFEYLELARTAVWRDCGLEAFFLGSQDFGFVVVESRLQFLAPLGAGARCEIETWFGDSKRSLEMGYELRRLPDRELGLRAQTTMAVLDARGRLCVSLPAPVRACLGV